MKKILKLLLLLVLSSIALTSCGGSDIPDGMQLICGGEEYGYYFYAPEEWSNSSFGDIARAHVSAIDTSSVSIVRVDMPEGSIEDYFYADMEKLPYDAKITHETPEEVIIGGVSGAKKFVYTFTESEVPFKAMQIYVEKHDSLYILTYQSTLQKVNEDATYYDFYYTKVQQMIDEFKFTETRTDGSANPADPDGDGYYLASDKGVSGFELYLPVDYELKGTSGMVSANIKDGSAVKANISIAKATGTGVTILDYMKTREEQLKCVFDDVCGVKITLRAAEGTSTAAIEEKFPGVDVACDSNFVFGNLPSVIAYEYTYVYNGTTYRTLQVYGANSFNGYVFTYTAADECFGDYTDEISTILEKVIF